MPTDCYLGRKRRSYGRISTGATRRHPPQEAKET
jgi:hypothetical protein